MTQQIPSVPEIPESEMTPLVRTLMLIIQQQATTIAQLNGQIQQLKNEIAILKKGNQKPKVPPSTLEKPPPPNSSESGKRPGSAKRCKTKDLLIHNVQRIAPEIIPEGAIFKDLHSYVVQDLVIENCNTKYLIERWKGQDGSYIVGKLPEGISGHFSATLTSFILYQYYGALVTRPRLLKQLRDFGIDISKGQLENILTHAKESFHAEKNDILTEGLKVSKFIQTDDTSARHAGKNGFCTVIGNPFFTWFSTTQSKNRRNFLKLLHGNQPAYVINEDAIMYMKEHEGANGFFSPLLNMLSNHPSKSFDDDSSWEEHLKLLNITKDFDVRIATEGALFGSLRTRGISKDLGVLSDDAGQFDIFDHALCWIHEERHLKQIVPLNEQIRQEIEQILSRFWKLYQGLKAYRKTPLEIAKRSLENEFDALFKMETISGVFNTALSLIYDKKDELLKVLSRPEIPLHNNESEQEIREYVKRRKISGGTRSEDGKQCRDTFTSLKKSCYKLGISFWDYLRDRLGLISTVDYLPILICQKVRIA